MNTSERKSYYDISSESSSNKRPFPFLARKRWKLIRDKIRKLKQSDQYISVAKPYSNRLFGYNLVKRSTSISTEQIEQISYVPDIKGRVVLVTSTSIKLYDLRDFSLTSELMIPMENENANRNPTPRYNRLAYASKMNLLIGWKPGGNSLFPLSVENFKNIGAPSTTKNPLVSVLSNSNSGSIISLELKSFSLFPNDVCWVIFARHWRFHFTNAKLIPDKCVPILTLKSFIPLQRFQEPCDKESEQTVSCPLLRKLLENYEFPSKLISFEENSNQNLRLLLGWKYSAWLRCIPCDDHFTSKYYDCGCDDDEKIFKSVDLKKFQQTAINHNSQISSVLFFTPLEILITGDICGTIKTWNIDQVQLAVFHSHLNEIIHFSTHRWDLIRPHSSQHISPSFISISRDGTMKCWQFWQSQCINPGDNQLISDDVQTNGTVRDVQTNSMMEVDSRKALMNLNSSILLENKYSHEVCGVCVKQHTGNIVLIGVKTKGDWKSESQTEYYLEHWTLSEPSSPLAEFPQTVRHISFVQLDEVYNVDDLELQQPNDCNQVEKADSINIAVVVCDGKPGSIHLISIPTGSIITTAICEDSAEDAVWHWMLEKLFVLQSNGTIAVFSTCSRPCSLLYVWKSAEDGAFYSGPLLLYPVHCPDYCKTILENKDSNDLQPQVILLFLVGTSNGSLAILCPQEGKILSKISTHLSTKTLDNPPDFSSSSPLSSIKSNPKSGRLYTVTVDGTIKVWQLIKPLPIIVQKKKIEDSDYDNANLRIHFKHFPFKIVNNTNIYCVYTAGDYSNTGRSKFPSDVSYYHTICAEVSDTWDNYSVFSLKTTCRLNQAYYNHLDTTPLKDLCFGLITRSSLNTYFEKSPMIEQIFLTISVDPIDQESLYLKIWRAVLESVRNNSNQNYKKAMLASTITPFTTENTSVNDIKCNIQLVNTLKLPFTTGSEAPQTTCRVLSVQSSGDILLTINNLMYFFRYTALINKSLYIRQNLLNSTNQRFGNIVTPVKLKNVIRCREWNKDELKKMNGTYLSLICNIRVTADFPSDENKTSEKNEILSKLKERDSDLDKILRKKYVEHRIKPSHITSQQGQQIAFNNYYEKILSKHSLSVPPHSKELDPDDDEEIVLLKEQLMITEQTHLQIECEAAVKHKPTNVKCKHSKQSKVARKRQTSPDINPNNYIEKLPDTIKLTSPRADSDICILPIQRPNGFFPKTVLHESGRSKYGWAPNSLLLGKYCSKLSQSETYDTKKTAKINWEEIEARLANSGFINKMEKDTSEDTMTSDFSTGWIVESDKELTMTSKELSEVDDMEKNMKEKLLASKFLNESSSDQHISLLDLQDQMNTELKQIQLADAEKILLSSDKWKVITRNELKQAEHSRQKEKDLLSNLIDRPPLHRPQYERENTIFLTEFRNSVSPDTFSAFVLPVFLERFKTSRWLPALGLLNNHIPEGWMDFNASSHPICFIQWMLWTNILPSICSQNVPPCMEDEDPYLCQTISELCYDMELLHTDFQLPEECINELHLCLTKCIVYNLENNDEFRGWKMLEAISKTLVAFGFHDIDTVVILLLLYVKVLLTTEKGDTHYPQEFTNNNLLLYIHTSLQSSGFKSKYYNYLEEELSLLNKLGKCTKPIMSGKILHISDCIHLVSNTDTLGYWIKVFKILYFWLENWYEISDGNLLKDKSPRYAKQTKSILLAAVQPRTVKKGVHWTKSDSDNNENPILKDGIKALNAFIDWCHQQKLSELREQAKEQAIKSTTMKPETDSVSKQRIQILQDGEESGKHKMVMLLPPLSEIDRCVVRLGESHVVERRKYRRMKNILQPWIKTAEQSSYQDIMSVSQSLRDPTQPSYAQPWRSYKNALTGHFPPKIHIKPTECNLLPFNKYQSFKEKLEHKLKEIETLRVKLTNMKKRNRFKKSIPYTVCNMDNEDLQNYQRFLTASIHDEEKELNTVVQLFIPILSRLLPIPMKQFSLPVIHLSHTNFKSLVSKAQYLTNYEEENQGDRHHDFDTNSAYLSGGLSAGLMSAT